MGKQKFIVFKGTYGLEDVKIKADSIVGYTINRNNGDITIFIENIGPVKYTKVTTEDLWAVKKTIDALLDDSDTEDSTSSTGVKHF